MAIFQPPDRIEAACKNALFGRSPSHPDIPPSNAIRNSTVIRGAQSRLRQLAGHTKKAPRLLRGPAMER
jgi:hypothetical protein